MAHREHNKRGNGGFFLILLGAFIFITTPTYLSENPVLGGAAIAAGFAAGGIGFYLKFFKNRGREGA